VSRKLKLTEEQRKQLAERHLLHIRLRLEAAKHSPYALAKEFGIGESTVKNYLNRAGG